jgi:hypothetical protein
MSVADQYQAFKQLGLKLDMSRGKPAPEQLDLSNALTEALHTYKAADGTDARNYGGTIGLPEARALFAELLDVPAAQVVVDSSSSLSLMHDVIVYSLLNGVPGHAPWVQSPVTFLCPVPGYDRHFAILRDARHQDDQYSDERRRPGHGSGGKTGGRGRQHQGHVDRAEVQQSGWRGVFGARGAAPGGDENRRAGLPPDVG